MLALAIAQWRRAFAEFQASDETWQELAARLRTDRAPQSTEVAAKIRRELAAPRDGNKQRRIRFTAAESQLVQAAARR